MASSREVTAAVQYAREHCHEVVTTAELARAEAIYGVPAEIITAIIGVETEYGGNTGNFRVLEALATLAFRYPRRAEFFHAPRLRDPDVRERAADETNYENRFAAHAIAQSPPE